MQTACRFPVSFMKGGKKSEAKTKSGAGREILIRFPRDTPRSNATIAWSQAQDEKRRVEQNTETEIRKP